jgi:hypothetical protein
MSAEAGSSRCGGECVLPERRFKLFIGYDNQMVLRHFVAAALAVRFDDLARDGIHQLLTQAIAGLAVHFPKRKLLLGRDSRVKADRAGDQRELEVAFQCDLGAILSGVPE